jgi:hypothetical protein
MVLPMAADIDHTREDSANLLAAKALSIVKTHDPSEVQNCLRRALQATGAMQIPAPFYVAALRQAGANALATWFQSACVRAGLDVLDFAERLKQTTPGAASSLCRRYKAIFAEGEVNATMIGNYAIALSRAGETDTLSALCAPELLFYHQHIESIVGYESMDTFHHQLIEEMYEGADRQHYIDRNYMVDVTRMQKVHHLSTPAIKALVSRVTSVAVAYCERLDMLPEDHPLRRMRPQYHALSIWSNIYKPKAYVEAHLHSDAWLVGIYYAQAPQVDRTATPEGGLLCIGCPESFGGIPMAGWPHDALPPVRAPGSALSSLWISKISTC